MKYLMTIFENFDSTVMCINVERVDKSVLGFPAEVGNPAYDQFLVDAQLTDSEVQALTPDTWYDFPKETI